ncbi:MAG TPA: biopolymer transporter ExbD [Candidatus Coprenecus pullicola]|jgi:biopolymer transport protein ExbD|nr:biopolymer transporter ExbD [Candidatus Coprenecus pullicola]
MASKKTPEINGGSMADISFLMLIFFLMVSTMDPETGLSRRLPPMPPENAQVEDLKVNRRNMLDVKINSRNGVMAGGQVILSDAQLEEIVIEFLTNPTDRSDLPSKTLKNIEGFGEYPVSDGVISLQNDRQSLYSKYVEIQNVLVRAINKVRNDFAMAHFGDVYEELNAEQQEIVSEAIPNRISEAEPLDVTKK